MIAKDVIAHLEENYPSKLAYDWDNVGLQVGREDQDINRVLVTLDVTIEVIKEAIAMDVDMIIAHHPMIFRPLKQIKTNHVSGQMIEGLIKHDIVLYIMHTNYDIASSGMNQVLADTLGLKDQEILEFTTEEEGLGRIGQIEPVTLEQLADQIKDTFSLEHVRMIGKGKQEVKRIAIVGGSGSSVIDQAMSLNVDVLITGDITYHHALDMNMSGLAGIDPGHHIEVIFVDALLKELTNKFKDILFVKSKIDTNPYLVR